MELKDLIKFTQRQQIPLLSVGLIFFILGIFVSLKLPAKFIAKSDIFVYKNTAPESSTFFTFEGFYANQAAKEFTDTAGGILESEGLVQKTLTSLGREGSSSEVDNVLRGLEVQKVSPNLLKVSLSRPTSEEARLLSGALITSAQDEVLNLTTTDGQEPFTLSVITDEPLIEPSSPPVLLNGLVAALAGVGLALLILSFREYLKS
jgi:capsular polysaccharide biosynthesis protein